MKTIWVVFIASMTGFADAKITREAIDNCDDLECLSNLMTESFGMQKAPNSDAGFLSTWMWYDQIRKELARQVLTKKKRGVGNLYQMMKTANFV
ncbi:Oidioi.mRNA.OKI2018_I69.chr1.g1003.t1.cds [Oikopleura dioica]|uniref:Oidioi.mRNA.OKI2018_I69.chr1.g1003.t1.cds n=1 Tax=Oikopleura dioica TaxID=34765 RepID=A0ABN7SLL2_OIKDI|nr:Oidioi.mRNA.OKI2018_I69.chr1.g1003.t1.cds [Oikopleura dioica]